MSEVEGVPKLELPLEIFHEIKGILRPMLMARRFSPDEIDEVINDVGLAYAKAMTRNEVTNLTHWTRRVGSNIGTSLIRRKVRERKKTIAYPPEGLEKLADGPHLAPAGDDSFAETELAELAFEVFELMQGDEETESRCAYLARCKMAGIQWLSLASQEGGTEEDIVRRANRLRQQWKRCVQPVREKLRKSADPRWLRALAVLG